MAELGIAIIARNQARGALDQFERQLHGISAAAGGVQRGLGGLPGIAGRAAGSLGRIAEFAIGGVVAHGVLNMGRAFVGAGKDALGGAMDLESALNLLQAQSGATDAQMAAVQKTALALGADLTLPATSAGDAALAMLELGKAGLSVDQAMAAAKGTLQLAAAGALSEAEAAETAANALNMFGLQGDEATRVANLLAAAANSSSAEVRDIADSLQMSGSVAAAAKMPIEDLVTAISQMANAGIKGSDAGTSIKQMLLSLQAPTDKAQALMDEYGIAIYDAQGAMLPLPSLIGQFTKALGEGAQVTSTSTALTAAEAKELERLQKQQAKVTQALADYDKGIKGVGQSEKARGKSIADLKAEQANLAQAMEPYRTKAGEVKTAVRALTQEERNAALATIFGSDAVRAANILLTQGAEKFDTMRVAVTKEGAAAEMAGARMKGLRGAIGGLGSQLETAGLAFATPLMDPLTKSFEAFAKFVGSENVQNALAKAGTWLGEKLGGAVERLGPWLDEATKKLPGFMTGVQGIVDIFQGEDPLGNWQQFHDTLAATFGEDAANKITEYAGYLQNVRDWVATHVPAGIEAGKKQWTMLRDDFLRASGDYARIAGEYAAGFRDTIATIKASDSWQAVTEFFQGVAAAIENANDAVGRFIDRINEAIGAQAGLLGSNPTVGGAAPTDIYRGATTGTGDNRGGGGGARSNDPTGGRRNASGTLWSPGGVSLVGEAGPELVVLPRGSRVLSNGETRGALAGAGAPVTVQIFIGSLGSAVDVEWLANRVARKVAEKQRERR